MREDHEELILRNPAFGAVIFWHLSKSYAKNADGQAPTIIYFVLAAGMLFHAATVKKISSMRFESGLLKAVSDSPDIVVGLQTRIEANLQIGLTALQTGSAAGILQQEGGQSLPAFRAVGLDLPMQIRSIDSQLGPIFSAAKRLGTWFSVESIVNLQSRLGVRF